MFLGMRQNGVEWAWPTRGQGVELGWNGGGTLSSFPLRPRSLSRRTRRRPIAPTRTRRPTRHPRHPTAPCRPRDAAASATMVRPPAAPGNAPRQPQEHAQRSGLGADAGPKGGRSGDGRRATARGRRPSHPRTDVPPPGAMRGHPSPAPGADARGAAGAAAAAVGDGSGRRPLVRAGGPSGHRGRRHGPARAAACGGKQGRRLGPAGPPAVAEIYAAAGPIAGRVCYCFDWCWMVTVAEAMADAAAAVGPPSRIGRRGRANGAGHRGEPGVNLCGWTRARPREVCAQLGLGCQCQRPVRPVLQRAEDVAEVQVRLLQARR